MTKLCTACGAVPTVHACFNSEHEPTWHPSHYIVLKDISLPISNYGTAQWLIEESLSISSHKLHVKLTEKWSRLQTIFTSTAIISVSGTKKQETGTDPSTNCMFLKGTKDNNFFQLHASVPEEQGKNTGRDEIGVKLAVALLLSTGQEPCLNQRPPSIRAPSSWHNGSLMVTINTPLCWQSSYWASVLLSVWCCSNDCVLWVQWKRNRDQKKEPGTEEHRKNTFIKKMRQMLRINLTKVSSEKITRGCDSRVQTSNYSQLLYVIFWRYC